MHLHVGYEKFTTVTTESYKESYMLQRRTINLGQQRVSIYIKVLAVYIED